MGQLKAGAAKENITSLATEKNVHDQLFIRALVLDDGGKKTAILSFDAADLGGAALRLTDRLCQRCDLEPQYVFLAPTHALGALDFGEGGRDALKPGEADIREEELIEKSIACVRMATDCLRPARIGYGEGKSHLNAYAAEESGSDGDMREMCSESATDKTLAVVKIADCKGDLIAALVNYAVRASFAQSGKDANSLQISGDFPGMVSAYVEQRYMAEKAVCLWMCGATRDQVPIYERQFRPDEAGSPAWVDIGDTAWLLCGRAAMVQGVEVIQITRKITSFGADLHMTSQTIENNAHEGERLTLLTLNDIALLGTQTRIGAETVKKIRDAAPLRNMMVIEQCGCRERKGYDASSRDMKRREADIQTGARALFDQRFKTGDGAWG